MKLFAYTFKNKKDEVRLCGYSRNDQPTPMICDDRQKGKLDNYAQEMAKKHKMEVRCHSLIIDESNLVETWDGSNEPRKDAIKTEDGDQARR